MAKATTHRVPPPRTLILIALALLVWLVEAALPVHAQRWTEEEGRWEFTGKMVVRPLQVEHWMEQGFSRERAQELYAEATAYTIRTLGEHVYRYFERMDEYWFDLPQGRSENDLGEELIATGYYRYVCPNWKTYPCSTGKTESLLNECPDDPLLGNQWHLKRIEACAAWQIHHDGDDAIVIGFVDDGLLVGHDDISETYRQEGYNSETELWESEGGNIEDIPGWCHGTHVLGVAAASGNNNTGVSGVGWTLRHRTLKTGGTLETQLHAMWVSAGAGDLVISSTAGGIGASWDAWEANTSEIVSSHGVIICQAAGNTATDEYDPFSAMVIVGGTQQDDARWLGQYFGSPVGEFIDVMAPAADIYSTRCSSTSSYGAASGTSYATPQVAGLCALIWCYEPTLDRQEVLDLLYAGCDAIDDYNPNLHGAGRINAFNSLALASGEVWTRDPHPGVAGIDNDFKAAGATSGATVRFYYGSSTGQTAVSGCSNVYVGIANASLLGTATAAANGAAIIEDFAVPSGWAGQTRYLQAVDLSDCRVSNLIQFTFPN